MNRKLDIVVDLDGVCADFLGAYSPQGLVPLYNKLSKEKVKIEDFRTWDMKDAVKNNELLTYIFHSPGFFRDLQPIEGCGYALRQLVGKGHNVFIATSGCTPHSFTEKVEWCHRHLPFLPLSHICLIHHKSQLYGDVIIDDGAHNARGFLKKNPQAAAISMAWPYNKDSRDFTALLGNWTKPFDSWMEIVDFVGDFARQERRK
jgi:5'(3')-deoxyribonucleotidase